MRPGASEPTGPPSCATGTAGTWAKGTRAGWWAISRPRSRLLFHERACRVSSGELSEEDRRLLLRVAREALVAHFEGREYRPPEGSPAVREARAAFVSLRRRADDDLRGCVGVMESEEPLAENVARDRKSTRLNSSHVRSSYAVFCLKKKK